MRSVENALEDDDGWDSANDWSHPDLNTALRDLKIALANIKKIDSEVDMIDIANISSRHQVDWETIAQDTNHNALDTNIKVVSSWRENQVKKKYKVVEVVKSRKNMLEEDRKVTMGLIAKIDVRTADSIAAIKIEGSSVNRSMKPNT